MNEPTRLLQDGSPRAKELLASREEDVPPDPLGGQERLLRALDLPPDSAVVAREGAQRPRRALFALAATSGLLILSAAAFGVSSSRDAAVDVAETPATTLAPALEAPAETPSAPEREPSTPAEEPSVDVHALAPAAPVASDDHGGRTATRPSTRNDVRGVARASAPRPTTVTDSADELALLERAQRAASQGRPDEALALVDEYRSDFPRGRFGVEMSVVEIEALARTGRVHEAATRGEKFLERHPGSPYTRRVEAIVRAKNQKEETR